MMKDDTQGGFGAAGMWDTLAPTWDARGDWHARVTRDLTTRMVDALDPSEGQSIVELACGPTADGVREVGRRLGDRVRLRAGDLSVRMLDAARRRAADDGADIEFTVLDVTHLDLPPAEVDGVLARWIYMLLPDPVHGLREARRVLKPQGRLVFAAFAGAEQNPFFTMPAAVLAEHGLFEPPPPGRPSMFALADTARTVGLIEAAGFTDPSAAQVPLSYRLRDADDLWSLVSEFSGPVSLALRTQEPPARAAIRTEIERRAADYRDGEGYALPGLALVFTAIAD